MEGKSILMEESSSRIEDPIENSTKDSKSSLFFGVFFCYSSEVEG
jgi:hypothetical protein